MTKIGCFSDTHGKHRDLKPLEHCDIMIFAGDCMNSGYDKEELEDFLKWYSNQSAQLKLMIAGNHDRYIENYPVEFQELLNNHPDIIYLDKKGYYFSELGLIYGIPDSREFYNWAFNKPDEKLKEIAYNIPIETNILISHAPLYGILDSMKGKDIHLGEKSFLNASFNLRNLDLVVCGHIHEGHGMWYGGDYLVANVSIMDERYRMVHKPTYIHLK